MPKAVIVKQLYHHYKGAWQPALNGLSFDVPTGEIFGLLGPNGAGKTTTMNIICGLLSPDSGSVEVLGLDVQLYREQMKRQLGFVPQHLALFGDLTAMQNLQYIGTLYNLTKSVIDDVAKQLLERLGLLEHAHKRVNKFSGGMKRRINIICSMLHNPQFLVLDEPTAGVDVHSRSLILEFLEEQKILGKTILYTSHMLEEAQRICDRIAIVDNGKLIIQGETKKVIAQTEGAADLEEVFLHYTGYKLRD